MATRDGLLNLARDDLDVEAAFETERLEAESIEEPTDIARWDPEAEQPVSRQRYVKPAHEEIYDEPALPEGPVGSRWVTEDGKLRSPVYHREHPEKPSDDVE